MGMVSHLSENLVNIFYSNILLLVQYLKLETFDKFLVVKSIDFFYVGEETSVSHRLQVTSQLFDMLSDNSQVNILWSLQSFNISLSHPALIYPLPTRSFNPSTFS